jgi:hypothetical protein
MDRLHKARSHDSKPASILITTLYDLITVIDARQGNQAKSETVQNVQMPDSHGHTSSVTERLSHMFDTGQIKFWNARDIKRKYAELFFS